MSQEILSAENAPESRGASRSTFVGLFLVTLATLVYELLLTRIFSVTMWYHCAFMAVSVAVFGMTVGAIAVYLAPSLFSRKNTTTMLSISTLAFSFTSILSVYFHLAMLNQTNLDFITMLQNTYLLTLVPFFFSGVSVCLVLTRYTKQISQLYAADLLGAAAGCLFLPALLEIVDGPSAVLVVALLCAMAACAFSLPLKRFRYVTIIFTLILAVAIPINQGTRWMKLGPIVRGRKEEAPLFEKWSMAARVRVFGDGDTPQPAIQGGWALSDATPADLKIRQLNLDIDSFAATFLTAFDGDFEKVRHLKYDVTNFAHYIRTGGAQLVIGVGGGRDVLGGLALGQKSVRGVELNKNIITVLKDKYAAYTGNLALDPRVDIMNDEARSYITRNKDTYDVIQMSMIDTFAASSAGAFTLSENSLYTSEAFDVFLSRLKPHGILSCSRWYYRSQPAEIYRLMALAQSAVRKIGGDPSKQIILIANFPKGGAEGVGTLMVSRDPFSPEDLNKVDEIAKKLLFQVVFSPAHSTDPVLSDLTASQEKVHETIKNFPLNIAPPTDDSPFFFQFARFQDWLKMGAVGVGHTSAVTNLSVFALGNLFVTVLALTLFCIVIPLLLSVKRLNITKVWPHLMFFCSIGFAFILVEIAQIQRLTIMLGNPTLGLCVVLFTLLLSSGIGSQLSNYWPGEDRKRHLVLSTAILCGVVFVVGLLTPVVISALVTASIPLKIAGTALLLFPAGLTMGTAFPLGMKCVAQKYEELTPWFWGLNGATSACASVLAIVIALVAGISAAYSVGLGFYVIALLCALLF